MANGPLAPTFVGPTEGRRLESPGASVRIVLGASSGAPFSVLEMLVEPGFAGPPIPHHHTREHASFHVHEGRIRVVVGGEPHDLEAGALLHLPPGVDFLWSNPFDSPARVTCIYSPAGFEEMFQDIIDAMRARAGQGSPAEIMREIVPALWARYGVERGGEGSAR